MKWKLQNRDGTLGAPKDRHRTLDEYWQEWFRDIESETAPDKTNHLNLRQVKTLLQHVDGKKYGLAIWLQIYLGLRIGELQALRWEDIDLETGRVVIRRMFVRKMETFRDYPKGRKQHIQVIPPERAAKLKVAKAAAMGELVVNSPKGNLMPYRWYLHALKGYCETLEIPTMSTHGLRHSTSELYMSFGASRDDLRQLFAHSSAAVTDRYIHFRGTNLEKVSNVIQLFGAAKVASSGANGGDDVGQEAPRNDGERKSTTNRPPEEKPNLAS
jgi:integrase